MDEKDVELVTSRATLGGWYGKVLLLLAVILVVPIWIVDYPPLADYPNHLARGYVLYHYYDTPSFGDYLYIDARPLPNLAIDLFLVALQPICDVRLAGKIFLTIALWLTLAGWHLLGRAIHGRPTWLALGGALVAYHSMFLYGFTNFSFGLGMFLVAAAAWLQWRETWTWWRLLLLALLAFGCYFSHLSAFLFLAGTALAVTFWEAVRQRKVTLSMVVPLVPVLLPLAQFARGGEGDGAGIVWNTLAGKMVGALCLYRGYHNVVDAGFIVAVGVFVGLLYMWATRIRVNGSVMFAGIGCVGMFLIGPYEIFGGMPADARFLPPACALIVLSLDATYPQKKAMTLLGLFLTLVVFRYGMIASYWLAFDPDLRDQAALFDAIPRQARVYPIVKIPDAIDEQKLAVASFHLAHYSLIDRETSSPYLFAFPGQQPIRYKTPPVAFHHSAERFPALAKVDWDTVFASYDYLWCLHLPDEYREFLQTRCTLTAEKGHGTIWRVTNSR